MGSVLVLGAGIGGLGAAIGLANAGHEVTLVERDPPPSTDSGDEAFTTWDRRHVPQFRQGHAFSARARGLLAQHAPAVLELLSNDGIEDLNWFKMLAPPEIHEPSDEAFTIILARRPAFELALRRTALETPGVRLLCPAKATGLLLDERDGRPLVQGARLEDGEELRCDVLIDATGRRSPVVGWLREAGTTIPEESQECGVTYHTRYFRQSEKSELPMALLLTVRSELDGLMVLGFSGDHRTYGITLAPSPSDDDFKVLRHNWAWDAVAAALPSAAIWVSEETGTPLNDVDTMAGHNNVLRHFVVDGKPSALGVLLVGDSLCTTNPAYGWGASMALTYAFAAVDAIGAANGDLAGLATRYLAAVTDEADAVYRESAAMDRLRLYRWHNEPVPEHERDEVERQSLLMEGVARGMLRYPELGRAFLRRMNLLESPRKELDPEIRQLASDVRAYHASKPPRVTGPDRDALLATIAAAAP